jgi:catechol 2,3-dioxygenase
MKFGPLTLTVIDLEMMLGFYVKDMGLKVKMRGNQLAELRPTEQTPEPLLILRHEAKAEQAPIDAAGLYHYALLVPDRKSLAATYLTLGRAGVVFEGHADHLVSEALYLTDPEGNGIEIYADRPRSKWKFDEDGKIQMGTLRLDIDSLVREVVRTPEEDMIAIPDGTRVGHVHLKVTELPRSVAFYQHVVGLDLISYFESAAFLSVGGYHHHIGMNTWESLGGPARKTGWSGLESFTIRIPEKQLNELASRLHDNPFPYSTNSGQLLISDPDGLELLIGRM